ncbi:MAG: sugar nucleotide-binding protein [Clostridia bacterium]|nr:sugar nucleotide-binding protein [Clostridia bacterium]MDD4376370.1 sugar nucleotide-binding protein [Clostridia bacterium]
MKKIGVLGANGMAGHVIFTHFTEKGYDTHGIAKGGKNNPKLVDIDVLDKEKLNNWLDENNFDVIINCIGLLNQVAENNIDLAVYLNSYLPHYLETKYKDSKTKVIHMSTDCVFSGKQGQYTEDSFKDGDTFYDRTKALGEIVNNKDLTFRMSIIGPDFNPKSIGLFNWFMSQTGDINGYKKVYWTGVTTIELARAMEEAIKQDLTGLYHLVPDNNISKHDLLVLFKEEFNRDDINIHEDNEKEVNKSLIRTRKDFDFVVSDYKKMVAEMKQWVDNHKEIYKEIYKM